MCFTVPHNLRANSFLPRSLTLPDRARVHFPLLSPCLNLRLLTTRYSYMLLTRLLLKPDLLHGEASSVEPKNITLEFKSTAGSEGKRAGRDARTTMPSAGSSGFRINAMPPTMPSERRHRPNPYEASSRLFVAVPEDATTRLPPREDRREDVMEGGGGGGGGGPFMADCRCENVVSLQDHPFKNRFDSSVLVKGSPEAGTPSNAVRKLYGYMVIKRNYLYC
jgi:hypothetical protein